MITNSDNNIPWFVNTEFPYSSGNVTMKMNYSFWDIDSNAARSPFYGLANNHPSLEPPPPIYDNDIMHESDDHPVIYEHTPNPNYDCDIQGNYLNNIISDDSLQSKSINSKMYHMMLIMFAFVGFTTFFMSVIILDLCTRVRNFSKTRYQL